LVESQNDTDKPCHRQPQPQYQNLEMHIYTIFRRDQRNINTMGAKLDFYPLVQAKTIIRQIFIHCLLIMEPGGFWIEVHPDPGTMGSSLPLFLCRGLSFARTADHTGFLSLHRNRNENND